MILTLNEIQEQLIPILKTVGADDWEAKRVAAAIAEMFRQDRIAHSKETDDVA